MSENVRTSLSEPRPVYAPDYVPENEQHFRNMLDQFRKAPTERDMNTLEVLWIFSPSVSRQDIAVALTRVRRERGFDAY